MDTIIFDISTQPYSGWAPGVGALICATVVLLFSAAEGSLMKWALRLFSVAILAVGAFISISLWLDLQNLRNAVLRGEYEIASGRVTYFVPDNSSGHGPEIFVVDGKRFEVSGSSYSQAFSNTVSRGGPNLADACLIVWFTENSEIVRLERSRCEQRAH